MIKINKINKKLVTINSYYIISITFRNYILNILM